MNEEKFSLLNNNIITQDNIIKDGNTEMCYRLILLAAGQYRQYDQSLRYPCTM